MEFLVDMHKARQQTLCNKLNQRETNIKKFQNVTIYLNTCKKFFESSYLGINTGHVRQLVEIYGLFHD